MEISSPLSASWYSVDRKSTDSSSSRKVNTNPINHLSHSASQAGNIASLLSKFPSNRIGDPINVFVFSHNGVIDIQYNPTTNSSRLHIAVHTFHQSRQLRQRDDGFLFLT